MVSRNLNPGEGFYLDPTGMTLPVVGPFTAGPSSPGTTTAAVAGGLSDDTSRKVRKPYTITKSRESWTEPEHDKFLEALQLFDRDWKKIESFIGSKTVIQIRSHAQKYFLKVQKTGTGEHLPPPRPKRKAAHPYPQKAPQNAQLQGSGTSKSTSSLLEPGYAFMPETSSMLMNSPANSPAPSWTNNAQTISFAPIPKGRAATNKNSSSSESTKTKPKVETADQGTHSHSLRVLPDFSQVYCFIGSVFDPCAGNHLQKLKEMDPIDVETVLLLMRNLSINLTSPDFEDHRRLLSMYEIEETNADPHGTSNKPLNEEVPNIAA